MGIGTRWILGHGNNQDNRSSHPKYLAKIVQHLCKHFWDCKKLDVFRSIDGCFTSRSKTFLQMWWKRRTRPNIQRLDFESSFNRFWLLLRMWLNYGIILYYFYWGIIVKHVQLLSGVSKAGFCLIAKPFSLGTMPYYNIMFSICSRTAPKIFYRLEYRLSVL